MKTVNYLKFICFIFCSICFLLLSNSLDARVNSYALSHGKGNNEGVFKAVYKTALLAPTKPNLQSPSNGAIFQILGTQLVWEGNSEATFYKLAVATDPQMTNIIYANNNVSTTTFVIPVLDYNTTYYWNVIAANAMFSSPASNTWNFKTMPANPKAVTTHPRLWFTQADLPKLQSWAVPSNPIYVALQGALASAITNYNTQFFPGGKANANWPDNGGITWSGYVTETYAEFFAFWSLIDPNPANRILHAQRARNLLMYVIDTALLGPSTGVPFRDPNFMTYDRSRVYGEACSLTVDWIYDAKDANGNNILTSEDKSKIHKLFMRWCNDQLTAYNHPTPIGVVNDKQLLTSKWVLNNYYSGHARNMTLMSLCMDDADDPVVDPNLPFSTLGNSLRSYLYNATGAWLYQQYAMYETADKVAADYGVSPNIPSLGYGSGGLPVEGALYGESLSFLAGGLLALRTAGWDDENIIGKQAKLITSDYWVKFMDGLLHSITPESKTFASVPYLGEVYWVACYGDMLRTWITPEYVTITGTLGLLQQLQGNQTCLDKARWYSRNVIEGCAPKLASRVTNVWANSYPTNAILYYMLLDPAGSNPPDPRPTLPLTFHDPAFHRILSRSDWTKECSWFTWHCHWTTINHQSGDGNQFELYRKGEWLVKERTGYTNDGVGYTSEFHNTLGLQNDVPSNLQWFEGPTSDRGGQWTNGVNAGDPDVITSIHDAFVYATGDATNLYNRPNPWTPSANASDILHASRSIVWLKPDHIVVYDRATSKTENRFKRFFLQFTAPMTVTGKNGLVITPGNQKLFLSNLLPGTAVLTPTLTENINSTAELEPTTNELKIEDPANPKNIRFLNVLQGADANGVKDQAGLIQSTSGTPFEGAVVDNTLVLFPNVWGVILDNTSYTIPATVTTQIITGLTPNGGYDFTSTVKDTNRIMTVFQGDKIFADSGGVLVIDNIVTSVIGTEKSNSITLTAYPNPFSDRTTISYDLPKASNISLKIIDLSGRELRQIYHNQFQPEGKHSVEIRKDELAKGVYLCELSYGAERYSTRLVVVK